MGGDAHKVKREDPKGTAANTIAVPQVVVYFRTLAGAPDDTARALAGVPFKIRIDGKEHKTAKTATDENGCVIVPTPAGKKVELEIFDTVYAITQTNLSPLTTVRGVKERLMRLGYEPEGLKSSLPTLKFDAATCAFETDAGVKRMGLIYAEDLMPADGTTNPGVTKSDDIVAAKTLTKLDALAVKPKKK